MAAVRVRCAPLPRGGILERPHGSCRTARRGAVRPLPASQGEARSAGATDEAQDRAPPCPEVFHQAPMSIAGQGATERAAREMRERGLNKVLVVTDRTCAEAGALRGLQAVLDSCGIEHTTFAGADPSCPTVTQAESAAALIRSARCDGVASLGGRAAHDCAKAAAMVAANGGCVADYRGVGQVRKRMLPMTAFAVSTEGAAGEMTRVAVLSDPDRQAKVAVVSHHITPDIAVYDAGAGEGQLGEKNASGMDALTFAVEAFLSPRSTPMTDACALGAINLIATSPYNHDDRGARMMSHAHFLAGMAFNSAGWGTVHAMSLPLSAHYGLDATACNAVLLPVVVTNSAKETGCGEPYLHLAQAMGVWCGDANHTPQVGHDSFIVERALVLLTSTIRKLSRDCGVPENLAAMGVDPRDFAQLAGEAVREERRSGGGGGGFQPTRDQVEMMYREAYEQAYEQVGVSGDSGEWLP